MHYQKTSLEKAISLISPNSRVFVQGGAGTPQVLLQELTRQADRLQTLTLIHLHTEEPSPALTRPDVFRVVNLFVGHNLRSSLDYDNIDYLPCFLSEIPKLFRSKACPLNVALLHVSPPDRFGYCSLGVSVDVCKAAVDSAEVVIAQVNPNMPRVHGDGILHVDLFDALVEVDEPLPESPVCPSTQQEIQIAKYVSGLVEDGSTLQMGIGAIPNAVARELTGKKDLGLHTEMWSDGALALIEAGALTNNLKKFHRGKCVSGFLLGSRRLYDFVNDNPSVIQLEIDYVNNPTNIARNPKVVAINSAVEVDLTGQICADSVGHQIISGVGGQMDFMRGAALSKGGKPIIALPSTTKKGESKLVAALKLGAGVVTTRAHAHYVVTEFGVASLFGKTIGERARSLIDIAHPQHREQLEKDFWKVHQKSKK